MSGYLLDTNVISQFAPGRDAIPAALAEFLEQKGQAGELYFSVITPAEIRRGVAKLRRQGSAARADDLERWLEALATNFADRILAVDIKVALVAGDIEDRATAKGRHPGLADVLIAATASVHGLTVVTRNLKHFEPLGVPVELPPGEAPL